jgi:hypothetical protein
MVIDGPVHRPEPSRHIYAYLCGAGARTLVYNLD